jgi:Cadmium carbonic anhydrase repeat
MAKASTTLKSPKILMIDFGILSDTNWNGRIQVRKILERIHKIPNDVDKAVNNLQYYYVPTKPSAKTRCIDGRPSINIEPEDLGPQVAGGAPGAAIAYRLGVDADDLTRGSYVADAEAMISLFVRAGMAPGGHRDETSAVGTVGCGAIDGMNVMLKKMTDPMLVEDHKRIVKLLMGKQFNRDYYLQILGAANVLNAHSDAYFRGRDAVMKLLEEKTGDHVPILRGEHGECILAVNLVPNTTLDSVRLSEDFGGIQSFGYDMWRSKQIAKQILGRPDQAEERERFIMARVMCSVATLMTITDGTQRFVLRMPNSVDDL